MNKTLCNFLLAKGKRRKARRNSPLERGSGFSREVCKTRFEVCLRNAEIWWIPKTNLGTRKIGFSRRTWGKKNKRPFVRSFRRN